MSAKQAAPLEARICVNPTCRCEFVPDRRTQVFHSTPCRKAYWAEAVHYAPHACPLCTVVHDPEEAGVLEALEMLIRSDTWDNAEGTRVDVLAFIARRRAILQVKPGAPN